MSGKLSPSVARPPDPVDAPVPEPLTGRVKRDTPCRRRTPAGLSPLEVCLAGRPEAAEVRTRASVGDRMQPFGTICSLGASDSGGAAESISPLATAPSAAR